MDMYDYKRLYKFKPNSTVDEFGVDHSNFSIQDELNYNFNIANQQQNQTNMNGTQYAQNNLANVMSDATANTEATQPPSYIFSQDMRNLLGLRESSNDYSAENDFGALGRYQLMPIALRDIGYYTIDDQWTGKNNIKSKEDFFNNHQIQEDALDEYLKKQNYYLNHVKAYDFVGLPIHGLKADFNISKTGLLAAAHRAGYGKVKNYLNALEKNPQGMYYMNYDKLLPSDDEWFRFVERRLREFEK